MSAADAGSSSTTGTGREARNMELMQTLDDAWNAQDMDVFRQRHRDDVVVMQQIGLGK